MKRKIKLLLVIFLVASYSVSYGQENRALDSLLNALNPAKEDTNQANLLNHLASYYTFFDPQKKF